jgi:hypothetical protein
MSTLETQYQNWLLENPTEKIIFVEWLKKFDGIKSLLDNLTKKVSNNSKIKNFKYDDDNLDDFKEWDVTLMDGLDDFDDDYRDDV